MLRGALILFELDSIEDASEVLHRGLRRFANKCLSLGRWLLEVGCFRRDIHAKEVWFRLTGLALHLWDKTLFFIFYFLIGKFLSPWDLNLAACKASLSLYHLSQASRVWDKTLFKYLRDCHGGFVLVDISIVKQRNRQWARILMGSNDRV